MRRTTTLPVAPTWAQLRASLRPARRSEQRRPLLPRLLRCDWREVAFFAAECAVVSAALTSLLALGAMLDM